MIEDLMQKLQEAQQKMEVAKKQLNSIEVKSEVEGGLVKVTANANRRILNISIAEQLINEKDKEAIEDLVVTAINKALEQADKVNETEMGNVAMGIMPNFPGL